MSDFYTPPTIQEMERDDPEDHLPLIYTTAMEMLNMNEIHIGKSISEDDYEYAFNVHICGIKNGMLQGTAIARENTILFFHPGIGEYVVYNEELQNYLLGFIKETKSSIRRVRELNHPFVTMN